MYGQDRTYKNFKLRFYLPGSRKGIDLLTKYCISCQTRKASPRDINTAPQLEFAETAESIIHCIVMNTEGPVQHSSKKKELLF